MCVLFSTFHVYAHVCVCVGVYAYTGICTCICAHRYTGEGITDFFGLGYKLLNKLIYE